MVLLSKERKLLFFHVPKCAGESVCKYVQEQVPDARRYNGVLSGGRERGRDIMHVTHATASRIFDIATESRSQLIPGEHGEKAVTRDTVRELRGALGKSSGSSSRGSSSSSSSSSERYFSFCFVRNPYTRVLSAYEQRIVPWYAKWYGAAPRPFAAYMRELQRLVLKHGWEKDPSVVHFVPACHFSHDMPKSERQVVDFVGRLERYDADMHEAMLRCGVRRRPGTVGGGGAGAGAGARAEAAGGGAGAAVQKMEVVNAKAGASKPRGLAAHTPETIAIVNRLYADDFRLLGYEMVQPTDPRVPQPPLPGPPLPLPCGGQGGAGRRGAGAASASAAAAATTAAAAAAADATAADATVAVADSDEAWAAVKWAPTHSGGDAHCWVADDVALGAWQARFGAGLPTATEGKLPPGSGHAAALARKRKRAAEEAAAAAAAPPAAPVEPQLPPPQPPLAPGSSFRERLLLRVERDLAPWRERGGVSKRDMERLGQSAFAGLHVRIAGGVVTVVKERSSFQSRNRMTLLMLEELLRWCAARPDGALVLPPVEIVLHTDDKPPSGTEDLPLFVMSKKDPLPWTRPCSCLHIMYPDHTFSGWPEAETEGWRESHTKLAAHSAATEWAAKDPRLFFRGAPTNVLRRQLSALSARTPKAGLDVVCTDWSKQATTGDKAWQVDRSQFVTLADHCKWKYLAHVPGNSYAARLKYLFLARSTVFWCMDDWQEFYYHTLNAEEHFVPIYTTNPNCAVGTNKQVTMRIEQMRKDDAAAQQLAQRGFDFVTENLTMDAVNEYWYALLCGFASLQKS
jgi:hypothetical protein